ncbi:hypothetical protein RB623_17625 [Mesorhizobium sp. LHD-90]|uniref:hypothetical protein n=1 Tax=Mesorhizobium sp. LHD-90 TaxID=3071414 RepID=UPI0027DFF43B|nr:hypothetical protein [Mesorhizobium sp. LHD-90]MDQ6435879.1 hypothetical protein [Mesorhizobium sp. LHD-90]
MIELSAAAAMVLASGAMAGATTLEQAQGAWVMTGTKCSDTFKLEGEQIVFIDRDASLANGIVIAGKKVTSPEASCTVERVKAEKDHFTALLGCSDSVMFSNQSVSFRILQDGTLERSDPMFSDVTYSYARCEASDLK